MDIDSDSFLPEEKTFYQDEYGDIIPGEYTLTQDIASILTGEPIAKAKTAVIVNEGIMPVGTVFGERIFAVHHIPTKQKIFVSAQDITR